MKLSFILGLTIASIGCAQAATPTQPVKMKVADNNSLQQSGMTTGRKAIAEDVLINTEKGKAITHNEILSKPSSDGHKAVRKAEGTDTKNGYVLYENFSGWDGKTAGWVPDGWTVDHRGSCTKDYTWNPITPNQYYPAAIDGKHYYAITDDTNQDEWLISPQFVPEEDMLLSYYMMLDPMWFYHTKNINWITKEYEGDKIQVYTFQILIKEGDGEWKILRDYADEYRDYTYREITAVSNKSALQKQTIALDEYVGKNVSLAFRYLGSDGDTMILDAIGVGYPTLDNVWYMPPSNSLYWGYYYGDQRDMHFFQMPTDIAIYPGNSDITWYNMSDEDATYTWEYSDQAGDGVQTSDDPYELTATYSPEAPTKYPKLYSFPVLNAEAEHRVGATYNSPVEYFQVGGTPSYTDTKYGKLDFTMLQFPLIHQEVGQLGVRYDKLGVWSVPVFGHSEYTDAYWLDYCLNGEEPMEGNFAHLIGIGNVFFPSEDAPLVVKGMHVYGWGRINKEAELTATIYALDSEMHTSYDTFTVVARATVNGDAVKTLWGEESKDYLFIPFEFDEAAVVQASEEHPAFVFMLEGFNSDAVEYFAPLQSWNPIETGMGAGYILSEINLQGHIEEGTYKSFKPMQYMENNEYKDAISTFAIGLVAEYPWLTSDVEKIEISDQETSVSLNSYYDGSVLTVEAPEGLTASVSGRYDKCMLTLKKTGNQAVKGTVDIKAPGLMLSIPVETSEGNAAASISSETGVADAYDLSGRKVSPTNAPGVYILSLIPR